MGDRLRQLLYPLVLPLIVGTIWVCGWVRQQEDRTEHIIFLGPTAAQQLSSFPAVECGGNEGNAAADAPDDSQAVATLGAADVDER